MNATLEKPTTVVPLTTTTVPPPGSDNLKSETLSKSPPHSVSFFIKRSISAPVSGYHSGITPLCDKLKEVCRPVSSTNSVELSKSKRCLLVTRKGFHLIFQKFLNGKSIVMVKFLDNGKFCYITIKRYGNTFELGQTIKSD